MLEHRGLLGPFEIEETRWWVARINLNGPCEAQENAEAADLSRIDPSDARAPRFALPPAQADRLMTWLILIACLLCAVGKITGVL